MVEWNVWFILRRNYKIMINKELLRIGNKCLWDNGNGTYTPYNIDTYTDLRHTYCLIGIEIKEDILLQYNFEICNGKYGLYYKHNIQDGFRIWQYDDKWIIGRELHDISKTYPITEIYYLHELQNVFLDLTKEVL